MPGMKITFIDIQPQHHDAALTAARWMLANPPSTLCGHRIVRCDETVWLASYRTRTGSIIVRYNT